MDNLSNLTEILGWSEEQIKDIRFVAYTYLIQGKYDIAIFFFKTLLIISKDPFDLQSLGAIHLEIGKNLDALKYLDLALKEIPHHYPSILNRAKALFNLGYKKQGFAAVRSLLTCEDEEIKKQAEALIFLYSKM